MRKSYNYYRCDWNSDEKITTVFEGGMQLASRSKKNLLLYINKKNDTSSLEKMLSNNSFNYDGKRKTTEQAINKFIEEKSLTDKNTNVVIRLESYKTLDKCEDDFDIILALFPSSDMLNQLSILNSFSAIICIGNGDHLDKWITKHNANPVVFNN